MLRRLGVRHTHYPVKRLEGVPLTEFKWENVRTSPFRLNMIAKVARRQWVPDALAQLSFLKKRYAPEVSKAINRAARRAGFEHELVPAELEVERCFVSPAPMLKRPRYLAKGRMSLTRKRSGHLSITLAKIDFDDRIKNAANGRLKAKWQHRQQFALQQRQRVLGTPTP